VNDIRYRPPAFASISCTFPVKPFGGSPFAIASAPTKGAVDLFETAAKNAVKTDCEEGLRCRACQFIPRPFRIAAFRRTGQR
jgi:hypothetical protein